MMEIIGIGVDIEENSRFMGKETDEAFLSKIFTESELDYCLGKEDPSQHLAVRFCAKEALIKASPVKLAKNQIEVLLKDGKPELKINHPNFNFETKVSLSHSKEYSVAMVMVYR